MNIRSWIEKCAGWCPNAGMQQKRRPVSDIAYPHITGARTNQASEGRRMVVDYHHIDSRLILAGLLAFAVFFVLFVISLFIPALRPAFYILTSLSFITYAAVHLYLDIKRAALEFLPNSIVLRRPLFRPLVFEKDSFSSIEMKKTYLPAPRWVFALFYLLLVSALFFSMTWSKLLRLTSGQAVGTDVAFQILIAIGMVALMLELSYRSLARLHYPRFLKLTLKTGEVLHLYAEHPDNLAAMLEADA
jgi:hypothetical protein